jgi:uncharacterized protein (TIGR02996 family)
VFGLTLLGSPRPIDSARLHEGLPPEYVELVTTWGPGRLCDVYDLPDPTEDNGRFEFFQHQLHLHGPALRSRGHWGALTDENLAAGRVLGVDRFGTALFAYGPRQVVRLLPNGKLQHVGTFEGVVKQLFDRDHRYALVEHHPDAPGVYDVELDAPANYVTTANPRAAFLAAVAAGDEAKADAELQHVVAAEIAVYALLDLAEQLAADTTIAQEVRASYVDQCLRMARRRATKFMEHVPLRDIRTALETDGELTAELASKLQILARPAGIFAAAFDAREAVLLEQLAEHPDDVAARLVYADHLEDRGEQSRAEALRAEAAPVPSLPDARARGFIAPLHMAPLDGAARLAGYIARWRADDPSTSIDDLVTRLEALHPQARQGYALLLAQVSDWTTNDAETHLARELPDAWPLLALALRAGHKQALRILAAQVVREAAPFVLSALRRPSPSVEWAFQLELAAAYPTLGKLAPAIVDEYVADLAGAEPGPRDLAARLLVNHGADDRVFAAYLDHFASTHPYSETAIKKRKKDPRVLPAILDAFATEEKRILGDDGRKLSYTTAYGVLARYLSKLGNARGRDAAANYRKLKR